MKLIFTILIFGIMFVPIIFVIYQISEEISTKQPKKKKYNIQYEMHMLDEAKWIEKVIKSCKTYKQLLAANKLSSILYNKYRNKVDIKLLNKINIELYWSWEGMIDQVIYD